MNVFLPKKEIDSGAKYAIRLLRDAAERGDISPWDVDVIPVIDGFLDQLHQRIDLPRKISSNVRNSGGSFELELAECSEAFLAASILVSLKAEILEEETFPLNEIEDSFDSEISEQGWLDQSFNLPERPEKHLSRRPVAPPPFRRPVTLGELIRQLEDIAESIEKEEFNRKIRKKKKYSDREIIAEVAKLAHKENLPETTAGLSSYLEKFEEALNWIDFELLVKNWSEVASKELDTDRVGVFWALLFLSSQGKIELLQEGSIFSSLKLKRILSPGSVTQLPISGVTVPDASPAAA